MFALALAAALAASPAPSAVPAAAPASSVSHREREPSPTNAAFAACAKAADEAICLMKLAPRGTRPPPAWDIRIAYAPEVVSALGPQPEPSMLDAFMGADDRLASAALIADRAGARPDQALAPIRAYELPPKESVSQANRGKGSSFLRLRAYQQLWEAYGGASPLPERARPSRPLVAAALAAWERELPAQNDTFAARQLAEAYAAFGDRASAGRVAHALPRDDVGDKISSLIAAGELDEAARMALAAPAPSQQDQFAGGELGLVIRASRKAGRNDLALRLATTVLERALVNPPTAFVSAFELPEAIAAFVSLSSKADAEEMLERLDRRGRAAKDQASVVIASTAIVGWRHFGRLDRAGSLLTYWGGSGPEPSSCKNLGCALKDPGWMMRSALLMGMMSSPDPGSVSAQTSKGSLDGVKAAIAGFPASERPRLWRACIEDAAGEYHLDLALFCAKQAGEGARLSDLIYGAMVAAERNQYAELREFMGLAYKAAAKKPEATVSRDTTLFTIGIGLLRAQGRL